MFDLQPVRFGPEFALGAALYLSANFLVSALRGGDAAGDAGVRGEVLRRALQLVIIGCAVGAGGPVFTLTAPLLVPPSPDPHRSKTTST